jgi:geranylgeranyl transferase type-2 subunit beta
LNLYESAYLTQLDELFAAGARHFTEAFAVQSVRFVLAAKTHEGGFRGRRGGADIYYTDFALRTLALLAPEATHGAHTAEYVGSKASHIRGVVECFNILNSARLLCSCSIPITVNPAPIQQGLLACRPGAYEILLAALCRQMLGEPTPEGDQNVRAVRAMHRPDGGFAERPGLPGSQTNATAAAVAFLMMYDAMDAEQGNRAAMFLAKMQQPEGGFLAHPTAPEPDLLSTFTALVALAGLDQLGRVNLSAAARFVKAMAGADGGFYGSPSDGEGDVEYTWYGVATAALLRAYASNA